MANDDDLPPLRRQTVAQVRARMVDDPSIERELNALGKAFRNDLLGATRHTLAQEGVSVEFAEDALQQSLERITKVFRRREPIAGEDQILVYRWLRRAAVNDALDVAGQVHAHLEKVELYQKEVAAQGGSAVTIEKPHAIDAAVVKGEGGIARATVEVPASETPETLFRRKEALERAGSVFRATLGPRLQQILDLALADYSQSEIAEVLDKPIAFVQSRWSALGVRLKEWQRMERGDV
jgi:DNA-directed RNA polymerase specialized sigma24 family protein